MSARVFILSPARLGGERARLLTSPRARFELAHRFQREGATIGELMSFVSGLYFRGKLTYARAFGRPPAGSAGALVIVPGLPLTGADTVMTPDQVAAAAAIPVSADEPRFTGPLAASATALAADLGADGDAVFLGSIATDRYVATLEAVLGDRLHFPPDFVGRGDMSRGAMLLRAARAGVEIDVAPLAGAARHGPRAPGLPRR
jgi:hypothetical protein